MEFRRIHLLLGIFFIALFFMQYRLWFESGGVFDIIRMKRQLATELQTNEQLKKRNQMLVLQVKQLQKNQNAVESRARSELGMVKKGETFYQIVE